MKVYLVTYHGPKNIAYDSIYVDLCDTIVEAKDSIDVDCETYDLNWVEYRITPVDIEM